MNGPLQKNKFCFLRLLKKSKKPMDIRAHSRKEFLGLFNGDESAAKNCEIAILNWTQRRFPDPEKRSWENRVFKMMYKNRFILVRRALSNNPKLSECLLERSLKFKDFMMFTPEMLEPDGPAATAKRRHDQHEFDIEMTKMKNDEEYQGILQCRKCRSKKTTYHQMQTRSADEPLTTFAQCLACGNRWRFC